MSLFEAKSLWMIIFASENNNFRRFFNPLRFVNLLFLMPFSNQFVLLNFIKFILRLLRGIPKIFDRYYFSSLFLLPFGFYSFKKSEKVEIFYSATISYLSFFFQIIKLLSVSLIYSRLSRCICYSNTFFGSEQNLL